jgi:hypothetical protein
VDEMNQIEGKTRPNNPWKKGVFGGVPLYLSYQECKVSQCPERAASHGAAGLVIIIEDHSQQCNSAGSTDAKPGAASQNISAGKDAARRLLAGAFVLK